MSFSADVRNVFHNAERNAFEADVTLETGGIRSTYAVSVIAPISTDFAVLRPALVRQAELAAMQDRTLLTSRTTTEPLRNRTEEMLERILFAGPRYLDEILSRRAA